MKEFFDGLIAKGPLYLAGQILGFFLIAWAFLIYVQKNRNRILVFKLIGDALSIVQYVLCGAYSGAGVNSVMCLREIVFLNREKHKWANFKGWVVIFVLFIFIMTFVTNGQEPFSPIWWASTLPAIGSSIAVVGLYSKKASLTRILSLVGICFWLVYVIIMENWIQVVSNVISIISIIIGLFGDYFRAKKARLLDPEYVLERNQCNDSNPQQDSEQHQDI